MTELLPCFLLTPVGWGRRLESVDLDPDSIVLFVDFVLDRPDSVRTDRGRLLHQQHLLHKSFDDCDPIAQRDVLKRQYVE